MISIDKNGVITVRETTAEERKKEKERLYSKAHHDEAQALKNATERERKKWQTVVATKDATIAEKDAKLADKDAENERLRKLLAEFQPIKNTVALSQH
jgi:hypothetical protein